VKASVLILMLGASVAEGQEAPPEPSSAVDTRPIATRGRVIDALGKPVRGATVTIEGTGITAKTDRRGEFEIMAPMDATLVVESKAFGVGIATVTGVLLDDIVLLTEAQLGETIEVTSAAPAIAPGAAKMDREQLQRVPGTGNDIVRALTVMPGVVNQQLPIGYSGVVIRGSSPQDSRVFVDNFDVPVIFHNVGFRAIVPTEAIESLDFVPGGFDVAYGHATSGVVLLKTRAGSEKRSTHAEASVIDGGLLTQGAIGKKTNYMFALRRSTIDLVLPSLIPDDVNLTMTTVPYYWDGQLRLDHELNEKVQLTLSALGVTDTLEIVGSKQDDADSKRLYVNTRFLRATANARFKNGPWSGYAALSSLLPQVDFQQGLHQHIKSWSPMVTPRFEVARTEASALGLTNVEWRAGGEALIGRSTFDLAFEHEPREGEGHISFDPNDTTTRAKASVWIGDFAAWSAFAADFTPRVRVNVGARAEYFARVEEAALSPRGEVQIKLADQWKLRVSAGAYRRPPEYQSEILSTTIKSERSKQTIAGLQWEPLDGARLQASVYYNDRSMLLRNNAMGELVNSGRGRTYGTELLANYRRGPWFAWLSYSLSKSTRVDTPGAEERMFDYDQPHNLNAAASWQRGRWTLGGRFQLYSGLPFTPVVGAVLDSDSTIYTPVNGEINSQRAPMHHQLDLRVDYAWAWGPVALSAFADVQNVYMNESDVTYFYSFDYTERAAFKSLPILPSLGLRGTF
jgi:outer membrane receptor protein involved in Fe transport